MRSSIVPAGSLMRGGSRRSLLIGQMRASGGVFCFAVRRTVFFFHVFHLSVNAGMENARLLPVLLLPPPSVLILLSPLLTSSITTNGRKSSIFDTLVHFEFRRDCDLGGDRRVPPA